VSMADPKDTSHPSPDPVSRRRGRSAGPVTTRSMSSPKDGWTIEQAVDLFDKGYRSERVEQLTGFAARHVEARAAQTAKAQKRGIGESK
jgi:hypothetical protein